MKLDKKISTVFILSLALTSLVSGNKAEAGKVKIINNSESSIRVDVVSDPEWVPYCKTCFDSCLQLCGKHTAEIIVPLDAFCGHHYFSMADMVDGFLGSGQCKHLNVYKNYEVTFSETFLGVRCSCKQI